MPNYRNNSLPPRFLALCAIIAAMLVMSACAGDEPPESADPDNGEDIANEESEDSDTEESEDIDTEASEETFEFQLAAYLSSTNAIVRAIDFWADEVESRTDGRVTFERFYDSSLYGPEDLRDALADNVIDFGHAAPTYHADAFPLTEGVLTVPFTSNNAPALVRTIDELYKTNEAARAEYENQGLRLMGVTAIPPAVTGTQIAIQTLEDFEGLELRAVGGFVAPLEAVGANPTGMGAPDVYEAVQRGVLDGFTAIPMDISVQAGLHEVTDHWTDVGFGLYANVNLIASLETWESLPTDIQQAMDEAAYDMLGFLIEAAATDDAQACDALEEQGVAVTVLPEEEQQRWADLVGDGPYEAWAQRAEAAGVDSSEYWAVYIETLERYETEFDDYVPGLQACLERLG